MPQDATMADALPRELAEQRFGRLYREHAREILGYASRRCADPEDAADAVASASRAGPRGHAAGRAQSPAPPLLPRKQKLQAERGPSPSPA